MTNSQKIDIRKLTYLAILTAIVVVLQIIGNYFAVPIAGFSISISLSLVPIVIAATVRGPLAGGWLGLVSAGVILLFNGATFFLTLNFFGTVLVVIVKGVLCGLIAGLVYKLISKKSKLIAVYVASAVCPIVNTGIFFIGGLIFFADIMAIIYASALVNFTFELIVNIVLSPSVVRIINTVNKSKEN